MTSPEYRIEVHDTPASLDAAAWDGLLQTQAEPTPFMRHACLLALHTSGSAVPDTGWHPRFLTLTDDAGHLQAACPLYLKTHSYGEYVFDWSWADAYRRHGLAYYPKALLAVPFTPVPGSRLLAASDTWRDHLVAAVQALATQARLSSAHVLFSSADDQAALQRAGWLQRQTVQFHWQQDTTQALPDFGSLLQGLQRDKRKKILQERRRVADAGVTFTVHVGAAITDDLWDFFHHCYTLTYQAHHSTPYLTRDFFARMAATMPEHWVMFVAHQSGARLAVSLVAVDTARGVAWGRYWGATAFVPCLHFEACYYQPLQWCIEHGFRRFEGGAQGEHKMARGLMPVRTHSAHWVADRRFASAIAEALAHETQGLGDYVDELAERSPFKNDKGRPEAALAGG